MNYINILNYQNREGTDINEFYKLTTKQLAIISYIDFRCKNTSRRVVKDDEGRVWITYSRMMQDLQLNDYENLRYLIRKLTKLGFIDKSEREYTAKNSTRVYFKLTDKANKMFSMEYDDFNEEELEDEDLEMVRLFEVKKEQTQEQKNLDAIANTFGNDEAVASKFKEWTDVARDSLLNRDRPVRIPKLSTKTFLENAIIKKAIRELLQCTPHEQLELLDFCINKKYGTISKDMLPNNKNPNKNNTYNNAFQRTGYKGDFENDEL